MKQPAVAFFGGKFTDEQKSLIGQTTTPYFYSDDADLATILREIRPDVLVSVGERDIDFQNLARAPMREHNRWIHYPNAEVVTLSLNQIYFCFVNYGIRNLQDAGLVSVFTTSYNSGKFIERPLNSLLAQTYSHWEWVIVDDSNGDENWQNLIRIRAIDPARIRIYRAEKNSGIIGHVKQLASSLCRGAYLIEVDHDDELTPRALEYLVDAGRKFPDAGFFYSDHTEIHEDGENFFYGDWFGLGYGAYRKQWDEKYQKWVNIVVAQAITPISIRWLVSCPNHFRAWRASTFREIGGWNPYFHVADDFEIIVRSFLHTKMVRVPYHCYYQYRNRGGNNHTFLRNAEIQKLWSTMAQYYDAQITRRVRALIGKDPWAGRWREGATVRPRWQEPEYEEHLHEVYLREAGDSLLVSAVLIYNPLSESGESASLESVGSASSLSTDETRESILQGIRAILSQDYHPLEVLIVGGDQCGEALERLMDDLLNHEFCQENGINPDRMKDVLSWWRLAGVKSEADLLNFATKSINLGSLNFIINTDHPEKLYDPKFLTTLVERFKTDPNLQVAISTVGEHFLYRAGLHQQYGYWKKTTDETGLAVVNSDRNNLLSVWMADFHISDQSKPEIGIGEPLLLMGLKE